VKSSSDPKQYAVRRSRRQLITNWTPPETAEKGLVATISGLKDLRDSR
jgi:hypothetical protein